MVCGNKCQQVRLIAPILLDLPPLYVGAGVEAILDVVVVDAFSAYDRYDPEAAARISPGCLPPFLRGDLDSIPECPERRFHLPLGVLNAPEQCGF